MKNKLTTQHDKRRANRALAWHRLNASFYRAGWLEAEAITIGIISQMMHEARTNPDTRQGITGGKKS